MAFEKTYHIFISHAWKYGDEYTRLISFLDGDPHFSYTNYSAPAHNPLHNLDGSDVKKKMEIMDAIDRKIRPSSCVLVISGMYAAHREWMQYEIDTAKEMGKPIIGVKPWGAERIPIAVSSMAKEMVGWKTASIVNAIKRWC